VAKKTLFENLGTTGGTFSPAYILSAMGALHDGGLLFDAEWACLRNITVLRILQPFAFETRRVFSS
jgi:hypothetical protein